MARGSRPASEMAPQPTFLVGQRSAIWLAVSGQGAVLALAHRSQHLRSCGSVSCSFIFLTLRVRVSAREVSQGLIPRWQPSCFSHPGLVCPLWTVT